MDLSPPSEIENFILLALKSEQAGDISGALRLSRQALEAARQKNESLSCAQALTAVARYRFRLGQYAVARELAQEARLLTDPTRETQAAVHGEALLLLGMCAGETNSLAECEQYYRSAADLAREIGHKLLSQRALHNLGSAVYLFRGQFDLAIAADRLSLQICRDNDYSDWAVFPLITLAIAYQLTGQRAHTRETLADLRALAQPGSAGEGYACYVAGMLALDEDDYPAAQMQFDRARALAEGLGDPSLNLDTRLGLSRLYRLRGECARALAWAEDALNLAQRLGYRVYQGRARLERARSKWLSNDLTSAEHDLEQAGLIFTEMDMRCDLAEVRLLLACLYHQHKEARAAALLPQVSSAIQLGGYTFLLERERSQVMPLAAGYRNHPDPQLAGAASWLLEAIQCTPPRPLRIDTFGGLAIWVGPKKVDAWSLRQRRAGELLVFLLASPGDSLSYQQVTEAMCPEKDPNAALDFYHHAISALRRVLEPDLPDRSFPCRYLNVEDEQVSLRLPADSTIDFLAFEEAFKAKNWQQALDLYGGEFLPGLLYAEWTIPIRQRLADQFEAALLAQAEIKMRAGDPAAGLELSRKALLNNPWQEQAAVLGMRSAIALGDRVTALRIYQRLEKLLAKELGIAPQAELQELYHALKKGRPR
jgi:DNA-binding SARP family transcriptional activator